MEATRTCCPPPPDKDALLKLAHERRVVLHGRPWAAKGARAAPDQKAAGPNDNLINSCHLQKYTSERDEISIRACLM